MLFNAFGCIPAYGNIAAFVGIVESAQNNVAETLMEIEANIPDKPFDLELSTDGSGNSIAMIGSTKSGKSYALAWILQHYFKDHIGVLMTNSPQANIYRSMPAAVKSPEYFPKILKDMEYINEHTDNHYDFLVVLDDVVTGVKFSKEILRMLCIGRNKGMSCCICVQDVTILNSAGRNNVNFMLFFKLNTDDRIEKVIKHYLNSYMPKNLKMIEKIRYYREATQDHHFLVLDTLNGGLFRTRIVA
jgi:hypothetical protein